MHPDDPNLNQERDSAHDRWRSEWKSSNSCRRRQTRAVSRHASTWTRFVALLRSWRCHKNSLEEFRHFNRTGPRTRPSLKSKKRNFVTKSFAVAQVKKEIRYKIAPEFKIKTRRRDLASVVAPMPLLCCCSNEIEPPIGSALRWQKPTSKAMGDCPVTSRMLGFGMVVLFAANFLPCFPLS